MRHHLITSIHSRLNLSSLLLTAALAGCKAGAAPPAAPACPSTFKDLGTTTGDTRCTCSAASAKGSVWGVDTYTQDSSLCAAAVHAGAIPASGGEVTVRPAAGCQTYAGLPRNGITSASWGNYPGSFYFVGKGNGACQGVAAAPAAPVAACPSTFKDIPGVSASTQLVCDCKATPPTSVWGSGIYTQDSSICGAAVHAGVIPTTGGQVTVKAAPGCAKYDGSSQNGITTQGWGAYAGSFYFPSAGEAHCAS
ncbi:MAG TPA: LCCL domain-containing protein [Kofleriaceae bacterium]|nr:LCCL domain-containing protein [Kofleriaceae bacterium]